MAHEDSASTGYKNNRPALGVRVPERGEMMVADYKTRDYRDQVRYNDAKWEVAERVIGEFQFQHSFDFGVAEIVDDVLAKLPGAIARAKIEWDEAQEGKKRRTRFSKSYASFKTLFEELRTAVSLSHDSRHKTVINDFIKRLSALSHNEYSAAELGFTEQTVEEKKFYVDALKRDKDEIRSAKSDFENRRESQRLERNIRATRRPPIKPRTIPSTTPASTGY
ncbi:hypothetical protein ACVXZ4_04185 [Lacisediminihabitans sp. FW035]